MTPLEDQRIQSDSQYASLLVIFSVIGVLLAYASSVITARLLGPGAYEHYAVAVATLSLLAVFAEAGVGKYALKALPDFTVSERWSLAAGYWRYAVRTVFAISLPLAAAVVIWESVEDNEFGDYPLGIAALFLPIVALSGVGIDLVMANRVAVTGTFIARLIVPGTTLLILVTASQWMEFVSPVMAIVFYCSGALASVILCTIAFWWSSPAQFFTEPPQYQLREWLPDCAYFASIAFLGSWTLKISLVVLELLPISETEIACFAAAVETGCLVLLLAKSTDKLFQPEMSVIIAQRSWA